jgi:hypothetical protein
LEPGWVYKVENKSLVSEGNIRIPIRNCPSSNVKAVAGITLMGYEASGVYFYENGSNAEIFKKPTKTQGVFDRTSHKFVMNPK